MEETVRFDYVTCSIVTNIESGASVSLDKKVKNYFKEV